MAERERAASGVEELDRLLGGLYIGDNVVWHDDYGSLASIFCMNFIRASQVLKKPLIYVIFDRSPKNLLDMLGPLARNSRLTILDCFTQGKGDGSPIFLRFYEDEFTQWPCSVVQVAEPRKPDWVMERLYDLHGRMKEDVRFVFESITGMQELWGGEDAIVHFYSRTCPRLYELNTIAYWIMEKRAHSSRLRAQIHQVAQVVIDLSVRKGTTSLTILKAEKRAPDTFHRPYKYWTKDFRVAFETEGGPAARINLDLRLRELRTKKGLSQTDLAKLTGVTPSTISQIEGNLIYPSLPLLLKMAEVLGMEVSSFFRESRDGSKPVLFRASEATEILLPDMPREGFHVAMLAPLDIDQRVEPYLVEILPGIALASHFFSHKGEELGYLLSGRLEFDLHNRSHEVRPGDTIFFTRQVPTGWRNPGADVARLLWMNVSL
ncbi:MAG: helix-turn-helix domain-containing protein [Deltaproteobacteria bacterium]|nr:helix-turn-helix domain-containing protein [Deltaproteobacteria bacterium]